MERISAYLSDVYRPIITLTASVESDTIVRTITNHATTLSLFLSEFSKLTQTPALNLVSPDQSPPLFMHASQTLGQALNPSSTPFSVSEVVASYTRALESVTAVANHTHFRAPVLHIIAAWAGESSTALPSVSALTTHVVLIKRPQSRQDDAALQHVLPAVCAIHGDSNVHVLRLSHPDNDGNDEGDDEHVPSSKNLHSLVRSFDTLARESLLTMTESAISSAERARRSARTTFRSWFSGGTTATALLPPSGLSSSSSSPVSSSTNLSFSLSSRRTSFSAAARVPLFDPTSVEHLTRRAADLSFMTARYSTAAELYSALVIDCRSLSGTAIVHEAAAAEMNALSRLCVGNPPSAVLQSLDRAVTSYVRASRPELAVRVALRATHLLPESAITILLRARESITSTSNPTPLSLTGSTFIDTALTVLVTACASCYIHIRKFRRSSYYAFVAMERFSSLRFMRVAACLASNIDATAICRPSVAQRVNLVLASNATSDSRLSQAVAYYTNVLSSVTDQTDVELQSTAVRGFLSAVTGGAPEAMSGRWDGGAAFPLTVSGDACIETIDGGFVSDDVWKTLEDDVLEDVSYFRTLRKCGNKVPKRPRRVDNVVHELRKRESVRTKKDVGGSLEAKIHRLRESAAERRSGLRSASLLEGRAVVGERIRLIAKLRNPLQFPIFINSICPVVSLDGIVISSQNRNFSDDTSADSIENSEPGVQFFPIDGVVLVPCSSQTISTEVIVKRPGSLRFIGMTWQFTIGMGSTSSDTSTPMPGFCILERHGKRLNNTRKQRASEMPLYAKDVSLSVDIVPEAPRLRTELLHKEGGQLFRVPNTGALFRAGEMREARLVVHNEGNAAVNELTVRIGTPQTIFVDVVPDVVVQENSSLLCAVGKDGDIVQKHEVFVASTTKIRIEPNHRVEIPLWLQASLPNTLFSGTPGHRSAKHTPPISGEYFDILEDGSFHCIGRVVVACGDAHLRVSRIDTRFKVVRSIVVSPRFMRETDPEALFGDRCVGLEGVLLGVEVEHAGRNPAENVKFSITELVVSSRGGWRPMFLPSTDEPGEKPDEEFAPSPSSLRINETATIFILVVRNAKSFSGDFESEKPVVSDKDGGVDLDVGKLGGKPLETFRAQLGVNRTNLVTKVEHESEAIEGHLRASTHFALSAMQNPQSTPVADEMRVAQVSVRWCLGSGEYGETHVTPIDPMRWIEGESVTKWNPEPEETDLDLNSENKETGKKPPPMRDDPLKQLKSDPVTVDVHHDVGVEHDFFKDPLAPEAGAKSLTKTGKPDRRLTVFPAEVPVRVSIRNRSALLIDVSFSAAPVGGIADGDRGRHWAGDVAMSLRSLPPGAERILLLSAVFVSPGCYNVSSFNVLCQSAGSTVTKVSRLVPVAPSFVTVRAVGKSAELPPLNIQSSPSSPPRQPANIKPTPQFTSNGTSALKRSASMLTPSVTLGSEAGFSSYLTTEISTTSVVPNSESILESESTAVLAPKSENRNANGGSYNSERTEAEKITPIPTSSSESSSLTKTLAPPLPRSRHPGDARILNVSTRSKLRSKSMSVDDSLWDDGDSNDEEY